VTSLSVDFLKTERSLPKTGIKQGKIHDEEEKGVPGVKLRRCYGDRCWRSGKSAATGNHRRVTEKGKAESNSRAGSPRQTSKMEPGKEKSSCKMGNKGKEKKHLLMANWGVK